jgi:hypothetical protein
MQLVFFHVPKTAGATFRNVLKRQYRGHESFYIHDIYPKQSVDFLDDLSNLKFCNYRLIAGHCTHFLRERKIKQKKIIILRNPIRQIISGFYHARRSVYNKWHHKYAMMESLDEYVDFLEETDGFNTQVNYLSISPNSYYNNERNDLSIEEQYSKSKELVDSCDYVLISELFDEGLIILKNKLRWKDPYYISKNVSMNRMEEETKTEIDERLVAGQAVDLKLYEYAKEKYQRLRVNEDLNSLKKSTEKFIIKNKYYNWIHGPFYSFFLEAAYYAERLNLYSPAWKNPPRY